VSEIETLTLNWEGLIVPSQFKHDSDPDWLKVSAVYVCEATYETCTVLYVGQTNDLLSRLRSHLVATVGLTYWLRDETGKWAYEPGDSYHYLSQMEPEKLERLQALARDTVQRQKWYFAPVEIEALKAVEALLIRAVKKLEKDRYLDRVRNQTKEPSIICDNGNLGMALNSPIEVVNIGIDHMKELLGEKVRWPMKDAA